MSFLAIFINTTFLLSFLKNKKENQKKIKKFPKVAIIVPAYNEEENIEETIRSLSLLDYPKNKLKIIVVDDGSKDKTFEIAKKTAEEINSNLNLNLIEVYKKKNGGKASALNFGIKKVLNNVKYIICMDADSVVDKKALKSIVNKIESLGENYMACVSTMNVYKPSNLLEKIQVIEYYISNFFRKLFYKNDWIYITPGPFSLYRSEFFKKHGFFEEDNIVEDTEIAIRIRSLGYSIGYCSDSLTHTKTPKKIKTLIKQRIRWYLGYIEVFFSYLTKFKEKRKEIYFFVLPVAFFMKLFPFIFIILIFKDYLRSFFYKIKNLIILKLDTYYLIKAYFEDFSFSSIFSLSFNFYYFYFLISFIFLIFFFFNSLFSYKISNLDKKWFDKIRIFKSFLLFIFIYPYLYTSFIIFTFLVKLFGRIRFGNLVWDNSFLFIFYKKIHKFIKNNFK